MNNENQIKYHIYWISKILGLVNNEEAQEVYKDLIKYDLSEDVCNEINALVSHIKTNY
jgi:hypothetical protein